MNNTLDKFMRIYGRWFAAIMGLIMGIATPDLAITLFFVLFLIYLCIQKLFPHITLSYFFRWLESRRVKKAMRR